LSSETDAEARRRVAWLSDELNRHLRLYHQEDAPEITDAEYDALFRELEALEAAHPELARPDSPTRRVGAPPAEGFAEFVHRVPMLSLDNAMRAEEVRAFDERVRRILERGDPIDYIVEPKLDGASIELVYQDGALRAGATRGDGGSAKTSPPTCACRRAFRSRCKAKHPGGSRCAARWCCRWRASSGSMRSGWRAGSSRSRTRATRPPGRCAC